MSTIPPLLSNSPPPPPSPDDEEDDEFGNFTISNDFSFTCDGFISSPSPSQSPKIDKVQAITNVTEETENNGIKVITEDININKHPRLQSDVGYHLNTYESTEANNENDILRIISGHIEKLGFNNEDIEGQKCTVLKDLSLNESGLSNSVEEIKDRKSIDSFINDDHTSLVESIEKSITIDEGDTNFVFENIIKSNCTADFNHFNGSNKTNGDFPIENTETVINKSKEIVNEYDITCFVAEEILKTNEDSAKLEEPYSQVNGVRSSILEELQQNNLLTCESSPAAEVNDLEDGNEDNVSHADICTNESSFDNSSSISQDKLNGPNEIISSKTDPEIVEMTYDISESTEQEIPDEFDDFGDFTAFSLEQQGIVESEIQNENADVNSTQTLDPLVEDSQEHKGNNDAFANFIAFSSNHISDKEDSDGEFADFASFEVPNIPKTIQNQPDDDGDFGVFSSAKFEPQQYSYQPSTSQKATEMEKTTVSDPIFLSLHEKEAFEKSKQIIQQMYPPFEEVLKDCEFINIEDDAIFKQLKDVTDTPALTYHWSKSTTQKCLLRSLNIDVRNMMFGPTWNPTIPRFAAHVGLQPLEPVKAENIPSTSVKFSPSISQTHSPDIPNVQFDWTSSGLVNPLEFSVDAKGTATQLPDILTQQLPETSLDPVSPIPVSSKSIEFPGNNDFREFESYQPPAPSIEWRNNLPLRETHISNISSELSGKSNIEAWLQPTIVTPELSRRKLSIDESTSTIVTPEIMKENATVQDSDDEFDDFQSTSTIVTPEIMKENATVQDSDDEFDDFQMVLPEKDNDKTTGHTIVLDSLGPNDIVQEKSSQGSRSSNGEPSSKPIIPTSFASSTQTFVTAASGPLKYPKGNLGITNSSQEDDDEFTDFHFSMPKVDHATSTILIPSVTPLEPTPVHPKAQSTQINWPDPGLTDEELRKFENVFSSPLNFKQEANSVSKTESPKKKEDDEEEWSEFVSVQKPSPVHKVKSYSERERTSSPDLTLSVFNLGSIQPNKPPVPIITPQGLVQTKLSSNTPSASPKAQLKHNNDTKSAYLGQQPSIISKQFASQAYNFVPSTYNFAKPTGPSQIRDIMVNDISQEEDEWGEFVSSPLPPKPAQNSWANQTPNIIMNPGHFVQSASDVGKRVSNFSGNKRSTVPNVVVPELDFIAPKARTTVSRKK